MHKIDLSNADFATLESGSHSLSGFALQQPGQPAKYKGFWWVPTGNDNRAYNLTVIGTGDVSTDTFVGLATPFEPGADHLALLGDQLVGHVREGVSGIPGLGGVGSQAGGVRILKPDGNPATAADWGQEFPVGEITERAGGLITLGGATFVLNRDGLYSFNSRGRSGEVFSDLRQWQNPHANIPMKVWKGGIVICHPSGLLFYIPGDVPFKFGIETKSDVWMIPPSGVTEMHTGLYHDVSIVGDFLYAIYQPDLSSTTALVMVCYGEPPKVTWQILGSITLNDAQYMAGITVATSGRPLATTRVTPTVWFGNGADLDYVILDSAAGPFRSRGDTHKVVQSGEAFMSEVRFAVPIDLTELVVYCSDMLSADQWQFSMIINHNQENVNVGVARGNSRIAFPLNHKRVHSLSLRITWSTTNIDDRVPPTLNRAELFGKLS